MRSGLMVKGINIARVARLIRCRARHRKRGFAQRGAGECQDTSGAGRDSGTLRLRQRLSFLSAKLGPPRASPRVVGLGRRLVCILHRAGRVRQALRIARRPRAQRRPRSTASQTSLCAVLTIFGSEVTSTSPMVAWRLFDSELVQDVLPTWSHWRFEAVVPPGLAWPPWRQL